MRRLAIVVALVVLFILLPSKNSLMAQGYGCNDACQTRYWDGGIICPESFCMPVDDGWGWCNCEEAFLYVGFPCLFVTRAITSGSECYGVIYWY